MSLCRRVGGTVNPYNPRTGATPLLLIRGKKGMAKISSSTGWGGRRKGAGRPAGSRNKPRLIDGLPITDCPAKWLLALVNRNDAPMRLRVSAAKALMPFMHPPC